MEKSLKHVPKDMVKNIEKWNICEKERNSLLNNLNKFYLMRKKQIVIQES